MLSLLNSELLPSWFQYPAEMVELLKREQIAFGPWQLLHGEWLLVRHDGVKKRFPDLELIPFARRLDCDDIACFNVSDESKTPVVKVIHDFASPGWEDRGELENFDAWLSSAKEEAKEWD